jgi:hypothetical protein
MSGMCERICTRKLDFVCGSVMVKNMNQYANAGC